VNGIVAALARLQLADPHRPLIHLPSSGVVVDAAGLWRAHLSCADRLRAAGLRPGQVLVSAAGNHPGFVALMVACRVLDLVLAPVDAGATVPEIDLLAERLGAAALVLAAEAATSRGGPAIALGDGLAVVALDRPVQSVTGAAVLKLTSGSTGVPKAAITTEAQLIADATQIIAGMRIGPGDTQMAAIPLSHSYGMSVVLMPLLLQGTAIVMRESFVPAQLPLDAIACRARVFAGVPFMFQHFLAQPPPDGWPQGLRTLISAGARLPVETRLAFAAAFGVKIHSFYGTTETGGIAYDADDEIDGADTVGRPLPGVTIRYVPHDGLPDGAGRIFVRSDAVSSGYVGDLDGGFVDGGYLTGDCGAADDRGRIAIGGRVSSFINVAGKKVEPGEIERVLRQMPGVRDVHITAAADAQRGEQVVACLVVAPDVTVLSVRRFCSLRLAPHKVPRTILFIEALPTTSRGKVDRRLLSEFVRDRTGQRR
jgi:long-chain acyl-CoA synthetase